LAEITKIEHEFLLALPADASATTCRKPTISPHSSLPFPPRKAQRIESCVAVHLSVSGTVYVKTKEEAPQGHCPEARRPLESGDEHPDNSAEAELNACH
jgi:hypothetical protein